MKKIAVMGANAARQKTLLFDRLIPGEVNRAARMSELPSGKGINFCRAARNWGISDATVVQFAGGDNGRYLVDALKKEKLNAVTITSGAPLRCCMTCIDLATRETTELIEPSGAASAAECAAFVSAFASLLEENCAAAAICGSLPDGTPPELYWQVAKKAAQKSLPLLIDAFKNVERLLALPGVILKINRSELARLTGSSDICAGIKHCFRNFSGITLAAITDGPGDAWASDGKTIARYSIPPLKDTGNPIGCGDTTGAVLLSELVNGTGWREAFKLALGAASANAETMTPAEFAAARGKELASGINMECTDL